MRHGDTNAESVRNIDDLGELPQHTRRVVLAVAKVSDRSDEGVGSGEDWEGREGRGEIQLASRKHQLIAVSDRGGAETWYDRGC